MAQDIVLRAEKVGKNFGAVQAVKDVSIAFERGRMHAVIGPNGAGKSTLMDLIVNRIPLSSGQVFLNGRDVTHVPPYKLVDMGICKCFQISQLFPNMTVLQNIQIALIKRSRQCFTFSPMVPDYHREEAIAVLAKVELEQHLDEVAAYLSYGDQKRLEIAIALAMEPQILILDEPVAGVARAESYRLMDLVRRLNREEDRTVIFVEHDMDIVFNYSDTISVLSHGELVVTDTPEKVKSNAFVQEAYLGGAS